MNLTGLTCIFLHILHVLILIPDKIRLNLWLFNFDKLLYNFVALFAPPLKNEARGYCK